MGVAARLFATLLLALSLRAASAGEEQVRFLSSTPGSPHHAEITADLTRPEGEGPFPAVVFMHGCAGLTPVVRRGIRSHSDAFIERGYVTLTVDSLGPRGKGQEICGSIPELTSALTYRVFDAYAALSYLRALPSVDPSNIFLVGQSNGGSVVLRAAQRRWLEDAEGEAPFRAIVAYYPWCGEGLPSEVVTPVLILSGENDDWTPAQECVAAQKRARGASVEVVVYPGAYHSFDMPIPVQAYFGHTLGGDEAAADDSRRRMIEFFEQHRARAGS